MKVSSFHVRPGSGLNLLLVCLCFASCGDQTLSSELHVEEFPQLELEPSLRIGSFEDPSLGFSRLGGVDIDHEGNVFVLEGSVPEIRVYDPNGALLRRIGQRGGGPGEFEGPPRFGVVGDTLWTIDVQRSRITLFDRNGAVLSTGTADPVVVPLPESYGYLLPWSIRDDGTFIGHFARIASNRDAPPTGVQATDRIPVPFVRYDATGAVLDTVGWAGRPPPRMWRPPTEDDFRFATVQVGDRRAMVPSPPTVQPWWEPVSNGYVVVDTPLPQTEDDATFAVTRFGLAEDTAYSTVLHYRPIPYSSELLDSIAARAARGDGGGMVPVAVVAGGRQGPPENWEEIARRLRAEMQFPPHQLPLESVWTAQDESIWLRRWDGIAETVQWLILDSEGNPRGELELPPRARPLWNRGNTLWAAVPDEYDVPWLVRYEIS